ncbi:MAG: AtpZ/AtpI family protein [Candidatus Saccharimonadaceae bacterium]
MTKSPRPQSNPGRTTKQQSGTSATMLILMTALDTTWRAFAPTLGGVFLGIGIDSLLNIAPIATFICLALGALASALLIAKQLRDVRKPL